MHRRSAGDDEGFGCSNLVRVGSAEIVIRGQSRPAPPSAAQARIITAALNLFAQHGVGGTSLKMIADEIGVTKAAVYHQYQTKTQIIRAVAEAELDRLEAVLDAAEVKPSSAQRREEVINGIVDLAVRRRRLMSTFLNDPIIGDLFAKDERLIRVLDRLNRLLMGADAAPESHVGTAMLTAAISGAVMHPLVVDLDDDTLRTQLVYLTRRFIDLPS